MCKEKRLKSGVTWVLGELGVKSEEVVSLLEEAVHDPSHPSTWWEAAFALEKLKAVEDPIDTLIENLPLEWTYDAGLKHLKGAIGSRERDSARVDQRAVVAVVKEYKKGVSQNAKMKKLLKISLTHWIYLLTPWVGGRTMPYGFLVNFVCHRCSIDCYL